MWNGERLRKMRKLAYKLSNDLINEKNAIGVLLYGSIVSGRIHERSDVDIATIYDADESTYPLREEKFLEGIRVDIWRYPISEIIHTFEDEQYRGKTNSWVKTSLFVELMRSCQIMKDPHGKLAEWKDKAKEWLWKDNEINPVLDQFRDHLLLLKEVLAEKDQFGALLCLRDTTALLVCICLMKHNMVPTWMPKDPVYTLISPLKKEGQQEVIDLFLLVNGLDEVELTSFRKLLDELDKIIKQECGSKVTETLIHYEDAIACLMKEDTYGALLSARMSGQRVGYQILENRGIKLKFHWPDAVAHLRMVNECRSIAPFFSIFYKRIHDSSRYNLRILNKLTTSMEEIKKDLHLCPF